MVFLSLRKCTFLQKLQFLFVCERAELAGQMFFLYHPDQVMNSPLRYLTYFFARVRLVLSLSVEQVESTHPGSVFYRDHAL